MATPGIEPSKTSSNHVVEVEKVRSFRHSLLKSFAEEAMRLEVQRVFCELFFIFETTYIIALVRVDSQKFQWTILLVVDLTSREWFCIPSTKIDEIGEVYPVKKAGLKILDVDFWWFLVICHRIFCKSLEVRKTILKNRFFTSQKTCVFFIGNFHHPNMVTAISGSTIITFLHEKINPKNWQGPLVMQGFSNCSGLFQVIMVNVGEYTSYMDSMGFRSCKQIRVEGGNKTSPPPQKKKLQFCRLFLVILWI